MTFKLSDTAVAHAIRLRYVDGIPVSYELIDSIIDSINSITNPNMTEFIIQEATDYYLASDDSLWKFVYVNDQNIDAPPQDNAIYIVRTGLFAGSLGWWWIPVDEIE
jgi:hypothetical protein